ncbi:hypothetical protein MM236_02020 [Belliella sp. DSM 107340]|uniref:Histidine kinase-, DNA gyrase B-, and HSP90-like ATPase n=1 Tax=Belliella calami TaxID=2923436 RepID=A0ABS9UJD7_9BACT|nr:hypothetical protein [Belliella calami]MCH7396740.1 hypothetical protein [Belliella calami]
MKSQKEVIEFLKEFWEVKSLKFQAQFAINQVNGQGYFYDLRHPVSRDLILHPITKSKITLGIPKGTQFDEGTFYWVNLNVPKDHIRIQKKDEFYFQADVNFSPPREVDITAEQLIYQISGDYYSAKGKARSALTGLVRRISSDVNRKPETFIFELLQNADDYPDSGKNKVNVRFQLKGEYIIVTHNGLPFSAGNVNAICDADSGNKQFDIDKTGYKGIGFKSIFKLSNYVIVHSGDYSFRFDEDFHRQKGVDTVWQLIPIWTSISEMPIEVQNNAFTSPNVAFCIKLKKGKVTFEEIESIFENVFADERLLLFLRNVKSISFSGVKSEFTANISESKWEISRFFKIEVNEDVRRRLDNLIAIEDERIPEKYKNIQSSLLKFATRKILGAPEITENTRVYAYLPTDINLGFPFLMNGDFIPDGSRNNIHSELEWNQYLFEEAGKQFINWLNDLFGNHKTTEFLKLIPDFSKLIQNIQERDKILFLEKFQSGFEEMLPQVAFLPDLDGNPQKIGDLTIDISGLMELLGEADFRSFLSINKPILDAEFAESKSLTRLFKTYQSDNIIQEDAIYHLLSKTEFLAWLADIDNSLSFLKFLNERKLLNDYVDQKIFLDQSGDLKAAKEIYFDLGKDTSLLEWLSVSRLHEKLTSLEFLKPLLKQYQPVSFIKEEILLSAEAKMVAAIFENNKKLLLLLLKYHDQLNEKDFIGEGGFKGFPSFDRNTNLIPSFSQYPIFLGDEELIQLVDSSAFPSGLVKILNPALYFDSTINAEKLWTKLGVYEWNESIYLRFVNYLFEKSAALHTHFEDMIIDEKSYYGNTLLWSLVDKAYLKVPQETQKEFIQNASSLPVIAKGGKIKSLKECYLSSGYTNSDALEKLQNSYPDAKIEFVSDGYLAYEYKKDWGKVFRLFKVKTDSKDFIKEYIIPKIKQAEEDDYLTFTQLLFENRDKFKEEIQQIEWKVMVLSGKFVKASEAILGSYFLNDTKIEDVLPSIKPTLFVSHEYGKHNLNNWADFFRNIGVRSFTEEKEIVEFKIKGFLSYQHLFEDEILHLEIVKEIFGIYEKSELSADQLNSLRSLRLKSQLGVLVPAEDLYLSKEYGARFDLSEVLEDPFLLSEMISSCYKSINEEIGAFLKKIGISDGIKFIEKERISASEAPKDLISELKSANQLVNTMSNVNGDDHYIKPWISLGKIEHITSNRFAKAFWQSILENNNFQKLLGTNAVYYWQLAGRENTIKIINYLFLKILASPSIPTKGGSMEYPSKLYSLKYKDIIPNQCLIPAFDFSQIRIEDRTLEELLGIRRELDLNACLEIIKTKPSLHYLKEHQIWKNFIKYIKEEDRLLTEEEKVKFMEFVNSGFLPNQRGEWKAIDSLFVVDPNIDTGITKDSSLIHDDLKKMADKFRIKVLSSEDFKPEFKDPINEGFKDRLLSRLKYISLLESPYNVEEKIQQLQVLVNPLTFFKTKKIELACYKTTPPIVNTEKQFLHLDNKVYYLRHWQSVNAIELFEFLGGLLNLKKVNRKTLIDLLILSEDDVLDLLEEKGISYPSEWKKDKIDELKDKTRSLVSKEYKEELINGVKEPTSNYEKGPDNKPDGNLSKSHVNKVGISDTEKDDYEVSYSQEEEEAIMRVFGDNAPKDFRKDVNLAAMIKGLSYLHFNGYDITEAEQNLVESHHFSQLFPVFKDGNAYKVKCRSAAKGLLYLKASTWKELEHPDTFLYAWMGPGFSDAKFCKSREEVIDDIKADYQVLRIEAKPSVSVLDSFMDGTIDPQEIMLIVRTKFKEEYRGIFENIRKKEKTDSIEKLNIGNEDED